MKNKIYRFRSINSLLGEFNELETQSIFFAAPEDLNDPMEGFRDIYWSGDIIVWRNLFKHYLLCLEHVCSLLLISGEKHTISVHDIPIFSNEDDYPTQKYKDLFTDISTHFFSNNYILSLIEAISKRTVRRDELVFYLKAIHNLALESIFSQYEKNGLIPLRETSNFDVEKPIVDLLEKNFFSFMDDENSFNINDKKRINALFSAFLHTNSQIDLIHRYNGIINDDTKNKNLVFFEFVEKYITLLEKLIYPEWYTACFMSECYNSSVWGHYGHNHTGACLIFNIESDDNNNILSLKRKNGYSSTSGPTYGFVKHKFYPIDYKNGYGEIDFFRMLGRLPIPKLNSTWYTFDGEISICADNMLKSEDKWRESYWNNFYRDITIKTKDWEYENEHRLVLSSSLFDFSERKDRVLTYDFNSLQGIIFGIKTKTEDKIKIMKVIENKCGENSRADFKFYQAYYSPENKQIEHYEMTLLTLA
ncbi:DUF2971 domain-containing protein [Klebsiella pneumoniae]|nr:DUF2971 domain-containing protein [Klebsiella pneumoniae]